ncbi:MAG TPA: hypothetical protein VKZ84_07250 [Bacteriovoracaceae bacterium]|nr:hypothetical protein [Bacteriovoracaceae bacterium]
MNRYAFYFVGNYHAESVQVYNYCKEHWGMVTKISSVQEIDQTDTDEQCVIIFSGAKEALSFLATASIHQKSFFACISDREKNYKDEVLDLFEQYSLRFYSPKTSTQLIEDLNRFLLGRTIMSEDIEFSIQLELGKDS